MGNPPISTDDYHFSFSLAIMGDSHVGKSTLVGCTLPEEAEEAPARGEAPPRGAAYHMQQLEAPVLSGLFCSRWVCR